MGIHVGLCERTTEKLQSQKVLELLTDWLVLVKVGSGHKKLLVAQMVDRWVG